MKLQSAQAPLHRDNDPAFLREQLEVLKKRGVKASRPNHYQIKVGPWNWYWNSGKIVIDPCILHSSKGFDALLELIEGSRNRKAATITFDLSDD